MPSFGSFETVREVYSGPSYTVYSAKKAGDPKTEYALKVFHLLPAGLDAESATDLAPLVSDIERSCSERIAVQQAAAAASKFITPVIETGRDERGVWYVTFFYPRSVNKIISGRVALKRDALEHLMRSIAQGALDFKRVCGRSHGEILPSVVQIGRSEDLARANVVLSDPLPGGAAEASQFELSDLRSIGRILLQFVLRREISHEEDFLILPILSTPEWTQLFGKDSARWLALCNRLLDPGLSLDQMSLERLVEEFALLRYQPPISRKAVYAIVGAATILLVAAFLAVLYFKKGGLLIATDPPGVEISLEAQGKIQSSGKTPFDNQPLLIKGLPKGSYLLTAEYPGLGRQTNTVTVEGGRTRSYKFDFAYGLVSLTSDPPNADVELNGKKVGVTPYTSPPLPAGLRTYTLNLTNYQPLQIAVAVSLNRQPVAIRTNLTQLEAGTAVVEFTGRPENMRITENGVVISTNTPARKILRIGHHKIIAQFEDWPAVTQEFDVLAGSNPPRDLYLPHGEARFTIEPSTAEIILNNKSIGRGLRVKPLQPGDYSVRFVNEGYYPATNLVSVREGKSTNIVVSLTPMRGFVVFTSDPPGATIFSQDKSLGETRPGEPLKASFPLGTYSFVARYPGLDDIQTEPLYVPLGTNIPLTLHFKYGAARFASEPAGADVLIAGKTAGQTPYDYRQKPGPLPYRITLPDYYPEEGTVDLKSGDNLPVAVRLRPKEVALVLRSDPRGSQFFEADRILSGSNELYSLPWGPHTITAKFPGVPGLPGPDPRTETVQVDKNGGTSAKFDFNYAVLDLTNAEPEALLLLQNKPVTNFPARLYLKPDVQYDFVVKFGGDFSTNLPVKIAARQSLTPVVPLPELRKIYTNAIGIVMMRVSKDLYAGKFEATIGEYLKLMPRTDGMGANEREPVTNVKLQNAQEFCQKLSQADAASLAKQRLAGWVYALPTEAEWLRMTDNDPDQLVEAVFSRLEGLKEADPQRKSKNRLEIYDLFGNVWEWCIGADKQPVAMGGSYSSRKVPQLLQNAPKLSGASLGRMIDEGAPNIGFRCVLRRPAP